MNITLNEEQANILKLVIEDAIDNLDMDALDAINLLNQINGMLG